MSTEDQKRSDQDFHRLYADEFEDACLEAGGAYMGTRAATGDHHEALRAAITAAFNEGVKVGLSSEGHS